MGNHRPVDTKCWIKFLELNGWKFSGRKKGSHHQYSKKGALRPIPVWANKKQIPADHISQSLRTMNVQKSIAYKWFDENC